MFEKIVTELSASFGISRFLMRKICMQFKKELIAAIDKGEEFVLSGLFSVKIHKTKAYSRINPFTKKPMNVKSRYQTKLIPSKKIKYHPIEK